MNDISSLPQVHALKAGVSVSAPARLHMGFFDLNGDLGRRYGSIGLCLEKPMTVLRAWPKQQDFTAEGPGATRAISIGRQVAKALNLRQGMHMQVQQAIPEHAGLGAGTQMSLAVGLAISRLYDLGLGTKEVALLTQRGAKSGIGLGTFAQGGVIIDGGRSHLSGVPPVIARASFPETWRVILVLDHAYTGVHGETEIEAFKTLPEFPSDAAARLCRRVLMQALPALAEHDLPSFGAAIRELQEVTGDHFAPVQGGRYASPKVAKVLAWLGEHDASCFGQSSWGPTGFAIVESEHQAEAYLQTLHTKFPDLEFMLCKGRNEGGSLSDLNDTIT